MFYFEATKNMNFYIHTNLYIDLYTDLHLLTHVKKKKREWSIVPTIKSTNSGNMRRKMHLVQTAANKSV